MHATPTPSSTEITIKLVVFDMAGTVVNEDNAVYKTLHRAITEAGVAVTLQQVLAQGAGKEKSIALRDIVDHYAPSTDRAQLPAMYQRFLDLLEKVYETEPVFPMDGSEELFRELRKRKIYTVINTGYQQHTANQLLHKLHWTPGVTFDFIVTASDVNSTRPFPDMIHVAMKKCGIEDSQHVMKVGDSIIDIEEGKNAGCGMTVGITTGAHTRTQLAEAKPTIIIDHLSELRTLLGI